MNLIATISPVSAQQAQAVTVLNPLDPNHITVKRYRGRAEIRAKIAHNTLSYMRKEDCYYFA